MSTSRLEKFIYAICSMEVSDLPAPLSRIEKLWNCLITGEIPDFEPQSRNEKYLMAMLDRYDISNLPTPLSRGEKLLYKIAVGETDLSDVPGYLSRYEELLKYLIENGGIGFEYVLYTLNQSLSTLYSTVEKPVKSAILKGNTLVNVKPKTSSSKWGDSSYDSDSGICTLNGTNSGIRFNIDLLKTSTKYLVIFEIIELPSFVVESDAPIKLALGHSSYNYLNINRNELKVGTLRKIVTTANEFTEVLTISNRGEFSTPIKLRFNIIEYQEGMENWDIPYFEGLQSVKMPVLTTTGNNLFDGELEYGDIDGTTGETIKHSSRSRSKDFIKTIPSASYFMYSDFPNDSKSKGIYIYQYDSNKNYIGFISNGSNLLNKKFTVADNCHFIKIRTSAVSTLAFNIGVMSDGETYEPYKTNILSTPSDLELRGVGEVQDTLDCLTGEVTERIGEIVLDGSEDEKWAIGGDTKENVYRYYLNKDVGMSVGYNQYGFCDKMKIILPGQNDDTEGISLGNGNKNIYIYADKTTTPSIDILRKRLSDNPITIQYPLETESIKTVDLTTVDQDGQPTKLNTFDNITHVEIKANNLIPSVDLEVATKISETLSTLGLDHHYISETQNKLGQTIEEQAENTDATMMATTEIYEQTL